MKNFRRACWLMLALGLSLGSLWAEEPLSTEQLRNILNDKTLSLESKLSAIAKLLDPTGTPEVPSGPQTLATASVGQPKSAPSLRLQPKSGKATTPYANYTLQILARSEGGSITALSLDDKNYTFATSPTVGLTESLNLKLGLNIFKLQVTDNSGQVTQQNIEITRTEWPSKQIGQRASLAILPMAQDATNLTESLSQFILETQRYRLVERAQLQAILQEQKLSGSLLADKSSSLQIGKLLSARYSLAGEVRIGKDFEVVTRLLDNETGEILAICDAYAPDVERAKVRYSMEFLAGKIRDALPWFQTELIALQKDKLILTRPDNITPVPGMDFLVVRREPDLRDDDTGLVLVPGEEVVLAKAKLEQVTANTLICSLKEKLGNNFENLKAISQ